jgi:hypothetical protein
VFFSGEGIWLEGIADEWFTPETRATIARCHAILAQYADAFITDRPTPLIPTLMGNVYANEFPVYGGRDAGVGTTDPAKAAAAAASGAKRVWTLYNANPRTVRGPVLRVEHYPGTRYLDAWNDRPAQVQIVGDEAEISLELGPKDVGCVVRTAGP